MSVARTLLQEQQHHEENERDRLSERLHHVFHRVPDEGRGVERIDDLEPGGKVGASPVITAFTPATVASAFAPLAILMTNPAAGSPFHLGIVW